MNIEQNTDYIYRKTLMLIEARNAQVRTRLQAVYRERTKGKDLPVFTVSNSLYSKYSKNGKLDRVEASGIPNLRAHCIGIAADAQYHEAKDFLFSRLSTLINSTRLWLDAIQVRSDESAREQDKEVQKKMQVAMDTLQIKSVSAIQDLYKNLITSFQGEIMNHFDRRGAIWDDKALEESRPWENWHWNSYRAFCRNNGDHCTAAIGSLNWNAKFIWRTRAELELAWELVMDEVRDEYDRVMKDFEGLVNGITDISSG